jgi:hypothetical protein
MKDPIDVVIQYQRDLFARLHEFFARATGKSAADFGTLDEFGNRVRGGAQELGSRLETAFGWLYPELGAFYGRAAADAFAAAKQIGGMKLILGGSSRFGVTQLRSVTTGALYADTILVPDPVMPWLEKERTEERFRDVLLLQTVHAVLHLKPLVDADLQYPAVLVFPSFEKTLEDRDSQTQNAISRLVADVFSHFLGENLQTMEQVIDFANRKPDQFLTTTDANHLFVAPDGPVDEPLADALRRHEAHLDTWRSKEWLTTYRTFPTHLRAFYGVAERLGPIYHLLENAEEIAAHPLMCLDQHAHYYKLVAVTNSAQLEGLGMLNGRTKALVNAMGSRRLSWLGRVPVDAVAWLRMDNANVEFRKKLQDAVGRLHESTLADVDKVAAEICHEIASAITDYEKEQRRLQKECARRHSQTLMGALGVLAVAWIPCLAPFLGSAATLATAGKYGSDKLTEFRENRSLTRSLMGVVTAAKAKESKG